jgi:hypothetical protein
MPIDVLPSSSVAFPRAVAVLSIALVVTSLARADEAKPPKVRVDSVRRVFHNGEHNAFTDLCKYRGQFYLTFRSCPDGHMVHPTSSIIVLRSIDGQAWTKVHQFRVEQRDPRDPHFLVFQDKLFVYTGTWYCGPTSPKSRDLNEHLGYAAWTGDGSQWNGPAMLEGTYGHYIWRAAAHGDRAYLCGRRKHRFEHSGEPEPPTVESALLESKDGLAWSHVGLFQEKNGDETAFLFEPDGAILAVARGGGGRSAELCRALPPYHAWERSDLGRQIGGPLVTRWGNDLLVGGRKTIGEARTALYWLIDGKLHEFVELPSAGDNSYPGFVALDANHALLSYYSSHERDASGRPITAIYLAELTREP